MKKIYETDRVVVELRSILGENICYPLSHESQIWLVREGEAPGGPQEWKVIDKIQWAYSLMNCLCSEQAVQAEWQERYVGSKPLKAEDYIGLWRKAMKAPVSLSALEQMGITLTGVVVKPLRPFLDAVADDSMASTRHLLEGMFVTQTPEKIYWVIPLDSFDNVLAYALASAIWVNTNDHPDQVNKICVTASDSAPRQPNVATYDLFTQEAARV